MHNLTAVDALFTLITIILKVLNMCFLFWIFNRTIDASIGMLRDFGFKEYMKCSAYPLLFVAIVFAGEIGLYAVALRLMEVMK